MPVTHFGSFLELAGLLNSQLKSLKVFVVGDHFSALFKLANAHIDLLSPVL
jgi:hypothetical protein